LQISCGSTYIDNSYARNDRGRYVVFPNTEDLIDSLNWANTVGFGAMEFGFFSRMHLYSFEKRDIDTIAQGSRELHIRIPQVIFPFIFQSFPTSASWRHTIEDFSKCIEITKDLGAGVIELTSPTIPDTELIWEGMYPGGPPTSIVFHRTTKWTKVWDSFCTYTGELCDMAKANDLKLAIEPRPTEMISNTDSMIALLVKVDSSNLGAVFDSGHHFEMKEILPVSIWKLGHSIFSVQLSDNDGVIQHHWAPGEGKIDWPSVLKAFIQEGYDGYLGIESSGIGRNPIDFVRAKKFVENILNSFQVKVVSAEH
jgi:sugar phosphate isomerase/epimerase